MDDNNINNRFYKFIYDNDLLLKKEIYSGENMIGYSLYIYSNDKLIKEESHYNNNVDEYYIEYDDNGHEIKWTHYDNGTISHITNKIYSDDEKLIKKECYCKNRHNDDMIFKRYILFDYYNNGKLKKESMFNNNDVLIEYNNYYYDDNIVNTVTYRKNNDDYKLESYLIKYYDNNNDNIKIEFHNHNSISCSEMKYDDKHNKIECMHFEIQ